MTIVRSHKSNAMNARRLVILSLCLFCLYSVYCVVVRVHESSSLSGEYLIIKIKSGLIRGRIQTSKDGRKFHAFYGIPYAEPPIGSLRLRAPIERRPWRGVLKCMEKPSMCVQCVNLSDPTSGVKGQEDCLYLNVFSPNAYAQNRKFPVIVYIHGGSLQSSEGIEFGPDYLLQKDIIFVNFNYRLGPLGFLSTSNNVISGNFGLKDQAMVLQWVHENIAFFGGDPGNVTLMGSGTGAECTHLHFFSPMSVGLFQKAILMSGSAFAVGSFYDDFHAKSLAATFAVTTGCYFEDPNQVLECFRDLPAEEFARKESHLFIRGREPAALFKPTVERNSTDAFLVNVPRSSTYLTKDIPLLSGITSGEGIIKVVEYLSNENSANELRTNYTRLLPIIFQYLFTAERDQMREIAEQIKSFYIKDRDIGAETDFQLVDMFTDGLFFHPFLSTVLSYPGPQYVYFFDYPRAVSTQERWGYSKNLGVCHGDDVTMILYNSTVDSTLTPDDRNVSQRLVNYWTNFVTYGNPNDLDGEEKWEQPYTNAVQYLHIGNASDEMRSHLWSERYYFWKTLPLGRTFNEGSDELLPFKLY